MASSGLNESEKYLGLLVVFIVIYRRSTRDTRELCKPMTSVLCRYSVLPDHFIKTSIAPPTIAAVLSQRGDLRYFESFQGLLQLSKVKSKTFGLLLDCSGNPSPAPPKQTSSLLSRDWSPSLKTQSSPAKTNENAVACVE
jgi:hypothetical protein